MIAVVYKWGEVIIVLIAKCYLQMTMNNVPLMVSNSESFPHSWLITWFVAIVTRRLSLVEQTLLTHSKCLVNGLPLTRCITMRNTTAATSGCPNSTSNMTAATGGARIQLMFIMFLMLFNLYFSDFVMSLSFCPFSLGLFVNIRLHKQTKRHTWKQSRIKRFWRICVDFICMLLTNQTTENLKYILFQYIIYIFADEIYLRICSMLSALWGTG